MSKTSKDYFNDGYYEAMNDLMNYIKILNVRRIVPVDALNKVHEFSMNKRPKETYIENK